MPIMKVQGNILVFVDTSIAQECLLCLHFYYMLYIIQGQQNIIVVALQVDLPFKLFTLLLILQCTIFGQC